MNHTPGPWEIDYGGTVGHIKSTASNKEHDTPTVCKYSGTFLDVVIPEKQRKANARLIAAAPEMLEALIRHAKNYTWVCREDIVLLEKATGKTWAEIQEDV